MDFTRRKRMLRFWIDKIGNILLRLSWHLVHAIIYLCFFTMGVVHALEGRLISRGLPRKYKSLHISKIQYLAIVIENEDACRTSNVLELLQWLEALGIKHVCLYDNEGILKKSKDLILEQFDGAVMFQDTHENNVLVDQLRMTLEFVSFSDGKEAVARAANVLLTKYINSGGTGSDQG